MKISLKPDFEKTLERFEAFWNCEFIDRPPVSIEIPKKTPVKIPEREYEIYEQQWLDLDFRVEKTKATMENYIY